MKDPNIKTKVVHSQSKTAWNIVGLKLGGKHKIASVPYLTTGNEMQDAFEKIEAFNNAIFISHSFNNSASIFKALF